MDVYKDMTTAVRAMTGNVREWESETFITLYGGPLSVFSRAVRPHRGLVPEVRLMEEEEGAFHLSPDTARAVAAALIEAADRTEWVR